MNVVVNLDYSVIRFLNQFAGQSELFDTLVYDIADSTLLAGGLFMAYFWWLWFRHDEREPARRRAILMSLLGAVAAAILSRVLQLGLPYHDRPLHTAVLDFVLPFGVNAQTLSYWNSFPSDHAVLFFALSTAVWYENRLLGVAAALWTLVVICLPRLYLGYHYPSDVIGGAIIGSVIMLASRSLLRRAALPERVMRWETLHTTAFYCIAFLVSYELAVLFYDVRHLASDGIRILRSVATSAASAAPR